MEMEVDVENTLPSRRRNDEEAGPHLVGERCGCLPHTPTMAYLATSAQARGFIPCALRSGGNNGGGRVAKVERVKVNGIRRGGNLL